MDGKGPQAIREKKQKKTKKRNSNQHKKRSLRTIDVCNTCTGKLTTDSLIAQSLFW